MIHRSLWLSLSVAMLAMRAVPAFAQEELRSSGDYERMTIDRAIDEAQAAAKQADAALTAAGQRARDLPPAGDPTMVDDVDETAGTTDGVDARIVNGTLTARYPSVGAVLKMQDGKLGSWCTGTLIGCRTFVSAQHCVEGDTAHPEHYRVFFQHGGLYKVSKIAVYKPYDFPSGDISVLTLDRDVTGIKPSPLYTGAAIADGTEGKIVGFGRTGGTKADYGLKRVGTIKTAACYPDETGCVCWNYTAGGLPGTNSNTCNADSGGPLLVNVRSTARALAGVTSGGTRSSCLSGDHSYDVDVRQFATWITTQAGADLGGGSCAALPRVGAQGTQYFAQNVDLAPGQGKDFQFDVPAGVTLLRIAMNGEDKASAAGNPITNFNLFVKKGSAATATAADCTQKDSSQVGACEFTSPATGKWFARVEEAGTAAGSAQLVVTMFTQP